MQKWLIGIDEAGRGPLAGPVAVGVVCVSPDFNWSHIPGVDDSKKLTPQKREEIFRQACVLQQERKLAFAVAMVSAASIDAIGIVPSVRKAMRIALHKLKSELHFEEAFCQVKLDGSLRAPEEFLYQETIIGGDAQEKVIGLASIAAKVTRDRHMSRLSARAAYAPYCFEQHKGYGTAHHRKLILTLGVSDVHRKSYCQKLIGS